MCLEDNVVQSVYNIHGSRSEIKKTACKCVTLQIRRHRLAKKACIVQEGEICAGQLLRNQSKGSNCGQGQTQCVANLAAPFQKNTMQKNYTRYEVH